MAGVRGLVGTFQTSRRPFFRSFTTAEQGRSDLNKSCFGKSSRVGVLASGGTCCTTSRRIGAAENPLSRTRVRSRSCDSRKTGCTTHHALAAALRAFAKPENFSSERGSNRPHAEPHLVGGVRAVRECGRGLDRLWPTAWLMGLPTARAVRGTSCRQGRAARARALQARPRADRRYGLGSWRGGHGRLGLGRSWHAAGKGIASINEKGKSNLHSETRVGKEVFSSFNVVRADAQTWLRASRVVGRARSRGSCS